MQVRCIVVHTHLVCANEANFTSKVGHFMRRLFTTEIRLSAEASAILSSPAIFINLFRFLGGVLWVLGGGGCPHGEVKVRVWPSGGFVHNLFSLERRFGHVHSCWKCAFCEWGPFMVFSFGGYCCF